MHMMLQHARLFLANRSVTIETLLRLNSPQIAFVDSWAMARSTFCVQDWDLTALMSGPPTHKKKYIKIKKIIKKKHEKMWKWKKNVELRWKPERNRRIALRSHCKTHQTNQVVSSGRWRQEWVLGPKRILPGMMVYNGSQDHIMQSCIKYIQLGENCTSSCGIVECLRGWRCGALPWQFYD